MQKSRGLWVVLGVLAVAGAVAWWLIGHKKPPPLTAARAGSGSQTTSTARSDAPSTAAPGHLTVVVSDVNGPLAGATVRMSRPEGDVSLAHTGKDGTATSDALEPGTWTVSASAPGHQPAALGANAVAAGENVRVEITLPVGGRALTGVVSDASGGAIAGARVDAAKLGAMVGASSAIASTLTGSDGHYSLSVPEGQLIVAASDASYSAQSRYVDVGPAGAVANFALVPGGVIEGVVRDEASHDPVGGAIVTARSNAPTVELGERRQQRAVAGADGHFRITGLRPGGYELAATAGPRTSRAPTIVALGVAEQVSDIEIVVGRAVVMRGNVVDEQGAPAAGAEVSMFGRGGAEPVTADAKGAFVIEGVAPGRYMLLGGGRGYISEGTTPAEVGTSDVSGLTVRVKHGLVLRGHVEPRQLCDVELEEAGMGRGMMPRMDLFGGRSTGADGAFEITPVDATDYEITARCPSGAHGSAKAHVTPGLADVAVTVTPGSSIAGKVVDKSGKPLAAVSVTASPIESGGERTTIVNGMITSGVKALTMGDGTYTIRGLGAGEYRLGVLDRGRPLPMQTSDDRVKLSDGQQKTGVDLTVDRPDGTIKGTVVGADGKPIADAWVSVQIGIEDLIAQRETGPGHHSSSVVRIEDNRDNSLGDADPTAPVLTDASGNFTITGLARVPMTVLAEAQAGVLRGQQTAVTPDATVTIHALGVSELRGTVHPAVGAAALSWFSVELEGPSREQRTFTATPTDTSFSFARVDPGTYTVTVTSSAGNGTATVTVEPGKPANVDITLSANAIVVGKLVDAAGKPLGGLPVTVIPDTGSGHFQISIEGPPIESGPDGAFRVEAKAGPSIVAVITPPTPTFKRGVVLEAGKTTDIGALTVDQTSVPGPGPGAGSGSPTPGP